MYRSETIINVCICISVSVNFTCDVYTNDSLHGACFPIVIKMRYLLKVNNDIVNQCINN